MPHALLLDDDPAFADLVAFVVDRMGWRFEAPQSPEAAVAALAAESDTSPTVVLLDSGYGRDEHEAILEALKARTAPTRVVLLAASWRDETPHEGLGEVDVARVIHKPIDVLVLERELAEITGEGAPTLLSSDTAEADVLRHRYRKQLEAAAVTLERAVAAGMGAADSDLVGTEAATLLDMTSLRVVLGRLAGTAGSYGYSSLSAQARATLSLLGGRRGPGVRAGGSLEELAWIVRAALSSPPPPLTRTMSHLGPLRWPASALVVGARPDVVTRVGGELSAQGVEVRFAPNIDDALELAEDYQPDLIVVDAQLQAEATDDFPVDEELRAGFARAIPMVLLGVAPDAAVRVRAANAGTAVFLDSDEEGAVLRAAQSLAPESYLGVKVFAVDDDPDITDLVCALLAPFGIDVTVAHTPQDLWRALEREKPALILLDIQLPTFDGHALCRTLKAHPSFRDITVVYLTGDGRPDTKVLAYQNGADDFMAKPVVGQELVAKVLSKLRSQQLAFRRQMTDPLTGALTQRGIEERALLLAARQGRAPGCGIMLVAIDELADLRAEAGVLTMERALRETSVALEGAVLGRDAVGRWSMVGADGHFLVLLLSGAPMAFGSVYERARKHLAEHPIFGPEGFFTQLRLSAGGTVLRDRDSLPAALERARFALADARQDGRSVVVRS